MSSRPTNRSTRQVTVHLNTLFVNYDLWPVERLKPPSEVARLLLPCQAICLSLLLKPPSSVL